MKILIAGATGFVGTYLIDYLLEKGYSINALSRSKQVSHHKNLVYFRWDIHQQYIETNAFENVDTIINLTGANIGEKRWTKERKSEIISSRIKSIDLLYQYVSENKFSINTFISSSAVGYYGAVTTDEMFKETAENGTDFLVTVCKEWENKAMKFNDIGIRTVLLRKGVIIGKDGGIVQKLAPLAKLGINVSLGSGKQYLPWIDIRDLVKLYEFILSNSNINGIYNTVSSEIITMNEFSKTLLKSYKMRTILPNAPSFIIRLLFGEMSVMFLEGSKVSNEKLKKTGFSFEFDTIEKSLLL